MLYNSPSLDNVFTRKRVFQFGTYLNAGFRNINRHWMLFLSFALMGLFLGMIGNVFSNILVLLLPEGTSVVLTTIITQCISIAISSPLLAGYFIAANYSSTGAPLDFEVFFYGFRKFLHIFLAELLVILLIVVASAGGIYWTLDSGISLAEMSESLDFWAQLATMKTVMMLIGLVLIPIILISSLTLYTLCFVWFFNLSAPAALMASVRLSARYFLHTLGFVAFWIVAFLFGPSLSVLIMIKGSLLVGFILLILYCISLLYLIPVYRSCVYALFADLTGVESWQIQDKDMLEHFLTTTDSKA